MNNNLRSILYLAIFIAILVVIFKFVSFMLPYVLIAALIFFVYRKVKEVLGRKESNKNEETVYSSRAYENKTSNTSEDEKIVDVDYKDV